jgi:hypothetical protein
MMVMDTPQEQKKPARSSIFEEFENLLTSGYGKKEDLRALDKTLREQYYAELMNLRHQWEKIYLEVLEAGQTAIGRECKVAIQTIDRLAAVVNRADYGYAPLFDRIKKIQNEALNSVLEFDRGLTNSLNQLNNDVVNAESTLKASTWPMLSSLVDALNHDLKLFEENWSKRKQVMIDNVERR